MPQSCPTLCNAMVCSPPGSSVHGFPRKEYWSGLPFPSPGDLLNPGMEPTSLVSPALAGGFLTTGATCSSQMLPAPQHTQPTLPIHTLTHYNHPQSVADNTVHSWGRSFHGYQCVKTCIHRHSIIQNSSATLKSPALLSFILPYPSTSGSHLPLHSFYSFAFSMS